MDKPIDIIKSFFFDILQPKIYSEHHNTLFCNWYNIYFDITKYL